MHDLCDFAMFCLNFHTLFIIFGLTYKLSAPSCQFLFSAVFVFQVFRPLKVLQKFQKNIYKKLASRKPPETPRKEGRATTKAPEGSLARPHPRSRQAPSWLPGGPSRCPLWPIFSAHGGNP